MIYNDNHNGLKGIDKMKKRILATCILAIMAIVILTGCSGAKTRNNAWDKVKSKGKFVMGLDDSFPPMGFRDEKNNVVGFDIDAAREVCKRLNIELVVQPINWDTKQQEFRYRQHRCYMEWFYNNKRKGK